MKDKPSFIRVLFCIAFFFLLLILNSEAQNSINTLDIYKNGKLNITANTVFLETKDFLSINEIDKVSLNKWKNPPLTGNYDFRFSKNAQWFKFKLTKNENKGEKFYLFISNKGINEVDLKYKIDGKIFDAGKSGDRIQNRVYSSNYFIFPIQIPIHYSATYYLYCDKRNENFNVAFFLYSEGALKSKEEKGKFYIGLFLGILTLASLVSLFLFISMKEKLHLWYIIYILSVINYILSLEGFDTTYLITNSPLYADTSRYIAGSLTLSLMIFVMQLFCKQSNSNSRFYTYSQFLKWTIAAFIPVTLMVYHWFPTLDFKKVHYYVHIALQYSGIMIILISTIEKMIQKYKPAFFYFSAVCILIISGIMATLVEVGVLDLSIDTPNQLQWSFILEVIIIANGILYRYNLIKKENEMLEEELNKHKIDSVRSMLQIKNEEQQRIAEDFHDLIGGQLSALKIKISFDETAVLKNEYLELIDKISENTRRIAHNLIPTELNNNSISDIIAYQTIQLNQSGKIKFDFIQTGDAFEFNKDKEINIYKILMEIINNIIKHSKATEAVIQFFFRTDQLEILVEDNGVGLKESDHVGIGMKNIHKRVDVLKGDIKIDSRTGNTTIIISIPFEHE
jgi:signal transduction histidine kinase